MKRKVITFFTILLLILTFSSCGTQDPPAESSAEQEQSTDQKEFSSGFFNGTTTFTHNEFSCEVPKEWRRSDGENNIVYFYTKEDPLSFLAIQYGDTKYSVNDDAALQDFLTGLKSTISDYKLLNSSSGNTSAEHALYKTAEVEGTISGVESNVKIALFECKSGYVAVSMLENKKGKYNYENDFRRIINSAKGLSNASTAATSQPNITTENPDQQSTEETKETEEDKEYVFSAGNYIVGIDIPSGIYNVSLVSGGGNCFAGNMNEIFGTSEYSIKEYKNLTLSSGDTIEITSTLKLKFTSSI